MSESGHGPCLSCPDGWCFDPFCCDCIPDEADRTPEQQALFTKLSRVAAEVLWRASGRRYGLCDITVRPCRERCQDSTFNASGVTGLPWTPRLIDGRWTNCRGNCNCPCGDCCSAGCSEVILPGPIHAVTEVAIGGRVLDPREYRVDDHRKLVRVGEVTQEPTTVGLSLSMTGAGQQGAVFPAYCDVTPVPSTLSGFAPLAGGCYEVTSSNQALEWDGVRDVSFRYAEGDASPGSRVLTVGNTDSSSQYQFPETLLDTVGESMVSEELADGTYARITKTAGAGTLQRVGNPLQLTGSATYRVQILRETFTPGGVCWPDCQDMTLPDGEPGTWSVTYQLGLPVSDGGNYAYSTYLCELWKSCTGQRCRLPLNAEGVFRQGVNVDFSDANIDLLSGMRTGIPEVDIWLAGVNPDRLRQPSQVFSPDVRRPRTQTWPFS